MVLLKQSQSHWSSTRRSLPIPQPRQQSRHTNEIASKYHRRHPFEDGDPPFRFLDLPAELRNRIYSHFFTSQDLNDPSTWQIEIRTADEIKHDEYNFLDDENISMSALLQTCHQINQEARTIPFNCNILYFDEPRYVVEFIAQLDPLQLHAIYSIEIFLERDEADAWSWGMMKFFPKLQALRLIMTKYDVEDYIRDGDDEKTRKLKEIRGLRDLKIVLDPTDANFEKDWADARRLETAWKSVVMQAKSEM